MTDSLAAEARRLRTVEQLSARQIQARLGIGKDKLYSLLRGVPPPAWTKRPNAKDDLHQMALKLRGEGWSVNDIALELGIAKSTAYQWVKHLPLDPDSERAKQKRARGKLLTDGRWAQHRLDREERRSAVHQASVREVGRLDERDLLLLGAAIYWCEGAKSKPWRRADRLQFINSDVRLLAVFLRFLEACGVGRELSTYRVSIHETADPEAAAAWWAKILDLPPERFRPATLKRHAPKTNRRNTGDDDHGCLIIVVPRSRELYWKVEGVMAAIAETLGVDGKCDA